MKYSTLISFAMALVIACMIGETNATCSFTDPQEAGSFGNVVLASLWDAIVKTDCCSTEEISKVFDAFFDKAVVVTIDDQVIADNRKEFKDSDFFQAVVETCKTPGLYVSWLTIDAVIDPDESGVFTMVTNEILSTPDGICGYGYSYTAKVSGEMCDDVKITALTADGSLTLEFLTECPT